MKNNPGVWFEIYVDDMSRAIKFYETVFETELRNMAAPTAEEAPSMEMMAFPSDMESVGTSGVLVKMDGAKAGGSNVIIYFACDDCAVEESRVEKAGGEVVLSKTPIGEHGYYAQFLDTEGNLVGLHSMA